MIRTTARKSIFALCILILLIGLVLFSVRASYVRNVPLKVQQPQQITQQFGQNDKTKALQVEKVEVLPNAVKAFLKNVSSKTIDGIQLAVNGAYLQIDFTGAEEEEYQRLLPGAIYKQSVPYQTAEQPLDIRVLAVTFTDNTADGDPTLAKMITDTRSGISKELKRIRPLLEASLRSSEPDSNRILDKLKSQAENLPKEEGTESSAEREGKHQARVEALDRIQFLRQKQISTGALPVLHALEKMKQRNEKQIQKGLK